MSLNEVKLEYEKAEQFILPLLENTIGLAAEWLDEYENGLVTALVPKDINR